MVVIPQRHREVADAGIHCSVDYQPVASIASQSAADGRVRRGVWLAFAACYLGVTLVYAHPLLRVMGSALPHDTGDPALNAWVLRWDAQALPFTGAWWNAPIFHPIPGTIAFS